MRSDPVGNHRAKKRGWLSRPAGPRAPALPQGLALIGAPLRRPDLQGCWRPGTGACGSSEWLVTEPEVLRQGCGPVQVLAAELKCGARAGRLLGARGWVCAAGAAATLPGL